MSNPALLDLMIRNRSRIAALAPGNAVNGSTPYRMK